MDEIRIPKQKRSIETKEKIVNAGLALFCTKGYYKTNTAEIAKHAGVSTGIVYSYFRDKKDIFLDAMEVYYAMGMKPIMDSLSNLSKVSSIKEFISSLIYHIINEHKLLSKSTYSDIEILQHSDEDVDRLFRKIMHDTIIVVSEVLVQNGFPNTNLHEKLHIVFSLLKVQHMSKHTIMIQPIQIPQ